MKSEFCFDRRALIPELRSAGKVLEVGIYPGQMHCFCLHGGVPGAAGAPPPPPSRPSASLKAFRDIDAFCRRYLRVQPRQIDSRLVTYVTVPR